jgi:hypothetical protein
MRVPPRLRIEPRPSRQLCRAIAAGALATAALAVCLPLPWTVRLVLALSVALVALRAARRTVGRGLPAIVHLGLDRRISVTMPDGRTHAGSLSGATYVGFRMVAIVWRPQRSPGSIPARARTLLVVADMLPTDQFRQLRVLLRYSRGGTATSGAAAVRPASHAPPS